MENIRVHMHLPLSQNTLLKAPKAVLFDWDGVIVDSEHMIFSALQRTFQHFSLEGPSVPDFYKFYGYSLEDAFKRDFKERWEEAREVYRQVQMNTETQKPKVFEGVQEFLEALSLKKIYCAVVSNKKGDDLRKEAESLNLAHYFSKIVGAQDAQRSKPFPDPVEHALKDTGLNPHHHSVWFIGDRSVDMECAHATKCIPIEAAFFVSKIEENYRYPPTLTIRSYQELIKMLK
ncbi:MAG: hypothetical protein B7Y25_00850 [Alphaproteobacteria bacterium 16-39-46]|nr:MAG: hypothetical protein B7Y25_00850 [Alphaproteobacteria bacterium 16-39-46]OZA44290.1 MAG: hypothetical protein B7X84_00950 [Alphaproteobacteria bacterium 17-39-52]